MKPKEWAISIWWACKTKAWWTIKCTLTPSLNSFKATPICSNCRNKESPKPLRWMRVLWTNQLSIKWVNRIKWVSYNSKWIKDNFKRPSFITTRSTTKTCRSHRARTWLELSTNSIMELSKCNSIWFLNLIHSKTKIQSFCPSWRTNRKMYQSITKQSINLTTWVLKPMSWSIKTSR